MANESTATRYMISDLPIKSAPDGTDIFLLQDSAGNAYQVPASALAISSADVESTINAWLAAHPEATTTVVDGSITMSKLGSDVITAFNQLSILTGDLNSMVGDLQNDKLDAPSTPGTSGQVLLSDGQGGTEWGEASSGLTEDVKQALLDCFQHVAWIDEDGQEYYDALYDALYPPVHATSITLNKTALSFAAIGQTQTLVATVLPSDATDTVVWSSSDDTVATVANGVVTTVAYGNATITARAGNVSATCSIVVAQATLTSISAVYTQSGTVYDTDSLDSLKSDLVVTATWSDSSTSTVAANDYTLSGTLTEGTSIITVSYGGQTTSFTVTVTDSSPIQVTYTQGSIGSGNTDTNRVSGVITNPVHFDSETLVITLASGYSIFPFGCHASAKEELAGTRYSNNILYVYAVSDSGFIPSQPSQVGGTLKVDNTNISDQTNVGWKTGSVTYSFTKSDVYGYSFKGLGFLIKKDDNTDITPSEIEQIISVEYSEVSS